jgi:hypothetical protein
MEPSPETEESSVLPVEPVDPYCDADGNAVLAGSVVLFVDLLGVRAMARSAEAQSHLRVIEDAVSKVLSLVEGQPLFPYSTFSDSIVIGTPINVESAQETLNQMLSLAAALQYRLSLRGIFLRGGLTLGEFSVREHVVFGSGLVDAYDVENQLAVVPRILLDSRCEQLEKLLDSKESSDLRDIYVRTDQDGSRFIDYISGGVIEDWARDPIDSMAEHKRVVEAKLLDCVRSQRVWDKYRWVAEFHNYSANRLVKPALVPELLISTAGEPTPVSRTFDPS